MNEATIRRLEFHEIRETLAGYCACALGKGLAMSVTPSTKLSLVSEWLAQVKELGAVADDCGFPPMGGIMDIREHVRASAFPAPLEPDALASVSSTLAATTALCAWLEKISVYAPSLITVASRVHDLSALAASIDEAIDARGEVRDYASSKLSGIRRTIEQARGRITMVFDRLLKQASTTRLLQYRGYTFHGDRMVLPLKAEHRGRIAGIVHRSSDSGATVFVEPTESVELNNTIVRLRDEEDKEITRILLGLTRLVREQAKEIQATLRAIGIVDVIAAKCRYAKKRSCVCAQIDESGVLELHEARHPLLVELFADDEDADRREVVPIDVRLGDDFDVLIVTGPNTGGKTVALKTVGLLALMTQCGMPIPVGAGSRMPIFDDVFLDMGDEQSLQQSLSTFSSHLATLLNIMQRSGPRSLVLIDELGAGTDPDEGAAIGRAVISELLRLGAKTIVTTHLSALKAVAYSTTRVDNAAVAFDPATLRPTYTLLLGEPGNSNALIIAKRLGMPARLVQQAKDFLDNRDRALNKAIAGTLQSRREAETARKAAREATLRAQCERDSFVRHRQELVDRQEAFDRWSRWVNDLSAGDDVYVASLKRSAKVVRMQLHKQTALVTSGAFDIEVPLRDIDRPREVD